MMGDIEKARAAADQLRTLWPDKAAEIDRAIEDLIAGRRDGLKVDVGIKYRLEKFDGEYEAGKVPVEVIEGTG